MPRLLTFNPETDYALASGRENYTPPKHVVELRRKFAMLPALYADRGDAILIVDTLSEEELASYPYYKEATTKGVRIVEATSARDFDASGYTADPWGWNPQIRRCFLDLFGMKLTLPSAEYIGRLRALSHRRTTILMLTELRDVTGHGIMLPEEVTSAERGLEILDEYGAVYFKAPWSSSGRGILHTDGIESYRVEQWLRGTIRKQGSAMAEKAYSRSLDFASEWSCRDGLSHFLGFSVFQTTSRGNYKSNIYLPQSELRKHISAHTPMDLDLLIERQRMALDAIVAATYNGPVGIDMLVTPEGEINPCVELNLRHTMGMIYLEVKR